MADRAGDRFFFLLWHFCIQKIATGQRVWFVALLVRSMDGVIFLWRDGDGIGATRTWIVYAIMDGHAVPLAI